MTGADWALLVPVIISLGQDAIVRSGIAKQKADDVSHSLTNHIVSVEHTS